MIAYFNATGLVKLVIEGPGSDEAGRLRAGADAVVSSRVANSWATPTSGMSSSHH